MLEPYEGKLSRTVLRGEGGSNALDLPDYYVFRWYAVAIKLIARRGYDKWIVRAHKKAGVIFIGSPEYIDSHSHLDPSGGLTIMGG